eukprot:2182576-Amphidinium_carterae.2
MSNHRASGLKRMNSSKEGLSEAAQKRQEAIKQEVAARVLRIETGLKRNPLLIGEVEKLFLEQGVEIEDVDVEPPPKKQTKKGDKVLTEGEDIPRCITYWGGVTPERLVFYLCQMETFFSVESLSVLKPLAANGKRRVRTWPKDALAELVEFLTGVHKDAWTNAYLGP